MIKFLASAGGSVNGEIRVPGDKSISHRSIILSSIATGISNISGFLEGEDSLNTMRAFQAMGVKIERNGSDIEVTGAGMTGLKKPDIALEMGNSGTAMRLMLGLLSGQAFDSTLTGDSSLSSRPMNRVINPLLDMGAKIASEDKGRAPLHISGDQSLTSIEYQMPVASAQVKSCILLAGLNASGTTKVIEPAPTRDHTERMLRAFGCEVNSNGSQITLMGEQKLKATAIDVPADISSAAFFMVAASIAPDSDLLLKHVGVNPTRTGVIDILKLMGANIELLNQHEVGGEPVADIRIISAQLHGIEIPEELVPLAIDEFPVLFVAAACATGVTTLTGAEELRVKESDRIAVMADGLLNLGVSAQATEDGMIIQGSEIQSGEVDSHGDHRIAMAFSVAALRANGLIEINNCRNVDTSFPGFAELSRSVGLKLVSEEVS